MPLHPRRAPGWLVAALLCTVSAVAADYPYQPVPFTSVRLTDGLWFQKQEINRTVTVPFALDQCEASGRLKNFDLAAEVMRRRAAGDKDYQVKPPTIYPFDDTDVYKAIEGAAYVLSMRKDPALAARLDDWIARIAAAQEPDGYLYTFRTMHPDSPRHEWIDAQRWLKDPKLSHELYNCGHLYEAGVAHFQATGKRTLLDVCLKNAELLWRDFGDRKLRIAPGHQIVEMGLVKLYRVTNDARWLTLAQIFLDARGPGGGTYSQQHLPVVEQTEAVGHAVRANYMYAGMADIAALTGDARYLTAIDRIWQNVVAKKLYLTGGTGALAKGEAYGADYELPHDGYNETCAALAFMMWNHRMFLLTGRGKYMDVFERTAFNGFLSGVSASGDRFFYPNPLTYDGSAKNNHGHAGRAPWFGCACCPPNLMRTLAALTGYFYAVKDEALYVNFYAASEAEMSVAGAKVKITQETGYPWADKIKFTVSLDRPAKFTLKLRLPGWSGFKPAPVPSDLYAYSASRHAGAGMGLRLSSETIVPKTLGDGYLSLIGEWNPGDTVELTLPMEVHPVWGNDKIAATRGQVALERGPIVYCYEDLSDQKSGGAPVISAAANVTPEVRPDLLGGVTVLKVDNAAGAALTLIPYYAWANRGLHPMHVWFPLQR